MLSIDAPLLSGRGSTERIAGGTVGGMTSDDPVEIRSGEFKRLGDCTTDDLYGAAKLCERRAETLRQVRDADHVRLAKAERLMRFYREHGVLSLEGKVLGATIPELDLSPILDADGKIVPGVRGLRSRARGRRPEWSIGAVGPFVRIDEIFHEAMPRRPRPTFRNLSLSSVWPLPCCCIWR